MDPQTLHRHVGRGSVRVVDVREPEEWERGHLDGSVLLPLDRLAAAPATGSDPDLPVVAVCRTGVRSAEAVERLRAAGLEADHLEGGLQAWVRGGLPLVRPDGSPGSLHTADEERGLHELLLRLAEDLQAYAGGGEVSEDEILRFLRDRLAAQGKTEAEIAAILDAL